MTAQVFRRSRLRMTESRIFEIAAELAEIAAHSGEDLGRIARELTFSGIGAKERIFEMELQRAVEGGLRE